MKRQNNQVCVEQRGDCDLPHILTFTRETNLKVFFPSSEVWRLLTGEFSPPAVYLPELTLNIHTMDGNTQKFAFPFVSVFICLHQSLSLSRFNTLSLSTISIYSSLSLSLIICLQQYVCSICCPLVNINGVLNFQEHPHIYSVLEFFFLFFN